MDQKYWNNRFKSGDWQENKGSEQTLSHYNILLKYMPKWLRKEIYYKRMSICDLGCGMGEGVNLFKKYFKDSEVTGVDFSNHAITEAKKKYLNASFICSDIANFQNNYDVVISSHTLEHFENPSKLFSKIINLAESYFILLIPFQEEDLFKEHFFSFDYNFFPIKFQNYELVYYKEIEKMFFDPGNYWAKEQILVVYANKKNININKFSLEELKNDYFIELKLARKNYEDKINYLDDINKGLESSLDHERMVSEDLVVRNKGLESKLNQEKVLTQKFKELNEKNLAQLLSEKKKSKALKKDIIYLEGLVNAYRSRKIVRFVDGLKGLFSRGSFDSGRDVLLDSAVEDYNDNLNQNKSSKIELSNSDFANSKLLVKKPKKLKDINVAVILDEFSYNSFKYEFNAIPIEPSNWLEKFENENPDIFFCESAWSGIDSEVRPWKGKICSSTNFKSENRIILLNILQYCKEKGIPTIFWNKEDPTHYDDTVNNFVDTALKFDHIFTTAEECVSRYKQEYGHQSVHSLMFGAQPKLFNPIEIEHRTDDVIFAGSWYNTHPQRCKEMTEIFDTILANGFNLKIYDRSYYTHKNDMNRKYPKKYSKYINLPQPHEIMKNIYNESEYALNINTETESKTMFSRRVFEIMMCNTLLLSNYSNGMQELFGNNVLYVDKDKKINLHNHEEKRINNLYNVLKNHTYSQRFKQILNAINYEYLYDENVITIYYVANTQSEIENILDHYESITYNSKKLVLLLSTTFPNHLIKNVYQNYSNSNISVYALNYLKNQNGFISNSSDYFVFANLKLNPDFIENGLVHFSYIRNKFGIALGHRFKFKTVEDIENVLFCNENFMDAFNNIFKNNFMKFVVYTIIIPDDFKLSQSDENYRLIENTMVRNPSKKLIISYCFPPYADSSGNVMAKRVREHADVVDVIQNDMSDIRNIDQTLNLIIDGLVEDQIIINSTSRNSFGNWNIICDFCRKGIKEINENVRKKGEYEEIYSRAFMPASHFLAFEYKIKYMHTKWIAEFSDPVLFDETGKMRYSKIDDLEFINKVNNLLSKGGFPEYKENNLFLLCEYLPYVFADELIFTNENQKEYMISKFPIKAISDQIEKKSKIKRHPTLNNEFYHLIESDYSIDNNYVNIAYFGRNYETRNLNDVFNALNSLNKDLKNKCKIHIFTFNVKEFLHSMESSPILENLEVNPFVNFLEFLNLTTKFDCLIVNDAQKRDINPYLPSKLSDYLGSGTDIWIIFEEDSSMSKIDSKYNSIIGDLKSTRKTLKRIIEDNIKIDS